MKYAIRSVLGVLAIVAAACSGDESAGPAVATPTVTLSKSAAAIGSPVGMTYRFDVAQDASIDGDYLVFMHVIGPDGEKLWQDDHAPAVPTSQWKPGQTVEYDRLVFVPNYPYIGKADIRVGLYDPASETRLTLNGTDADGRREYVVGSIDLLPQTDSIYLIRKDGWHPAEVDPNNPLVEWEWTQKSATLAFRNPKKDATFYLQIDARTDLFNPPQQVTVTAGGQLIATFAADSRDPILRTFDISAEQFGTADMSEIVLEVDRTFSGATGDSRELGVRVYHAFLEPR
jgi:hypothetical protein